MSISEFSAQCQKFEAATLQQQVALGQPPQAHLPLPHAALVQKVIECDARDSDAAASDIKADLANMLNKHLEEYSPARLALSTAAISDRLVWELFSRQNVLDTHAVEAAESQQQQQQQQQQKQHYTVALLEEFSLHSSDVRRTKQAALFRTDVFTLSDVFRFFFADHCTNGVFPQFSNSSSEQQQQQEQHFQVFACTNLAAVVAESNVVGSTKTSGSSSSVALGARQVPPAEVQGKKLEDFTSGTVLIFRHLQEKCDHVVVISTVERVLLPPGTLSERPYSTYLRKHDIKLCDMCSSVPAAFAAYGCRLAPPPSPSLFCRTCYETVHGQSGDLKADDGECCVVTLPKVK